MHPLLLAFFIITSSLVCSAQTQITNPAKRPRVILISIDGFPAWIWKDPSLPAPNLRQLAANGASTEAMTVSNPSITWINHTTLITGVSPRKHGVLFNGLLVRQGPGKHPKVEQWVDKDQMVFAPTLYDLAHAKGLTTGEVNWVAVTNAKTIAHSFPERPRLEGPIEKAMIDKGILTTDDILGYQSGPTSRNIAWRDETWTKAAIHILREHQPDLLLYHTLNTDAIHHRHGPATWASYTALAYADRLVGDLVDAVDEAGLADQTTFIITTDHGFKKVTHYVYPNIALKQARYLKALGPTITSADVSAVTQGGMAFVYINRPERRTELLPQIKALLQQTEGIDQVIEGKDANSLGMPTPEENQGTGDLILYAKPGYAFNANAAGDAITGPAENYGGTHGYPASDPELDGIFIASGPAIKKGILLPRMANLDVAPTIAKILNLEIPNPEGKVLTEVLTGQ
ncbi:alkaline phosphatase family protein [Phragmitibacter flavus]|uniref:Alkaline phosphatase family protein n=1 Tax=Phragmitibacter flavus TaxID=2576071 RepID=A0A5R8KBR5_9BACT|nr:alkaline phosphatase family protein [Phragmitibacter flavus]TLD69741.1 alkaline phosphatase family protein [Phragmitibacter flavus]